MQFKEFLKEAPKAPPVSGDAAAIIERMNKGVKGMPAVKLPKLPREMLNHAIEEAVARINAAGTGNAHDVKFPYDSDFVLAKKAERIAKPGKGAMDPSLVKSPVFQQYLDAVGVLDKVAEPAELYGKLVYNLIIRLWASLGYIHRPDATGGRIDADDIFNLKLGLKALGVKIVDPRR